MEITCPHCSQAIEVDDDTLASLAGRDSFACPACWEQVPLATVEGLPAAEPPFPAPALAARRRGFHRNLVILGTVVLLLLAGLVAFVASRKPATDRRTVKAVTEETVNNKFFTELVAAGKTTLKDLEAVTDVRPFGIGFLAVSKEGLSWAEAEALAGRVGGEVLVIDLAGTSANEPWRRPSSQTERLLERLSEAYPERKGRTIWVRDHTGEARVIDIPAVHPVTTLERRRPVLLHWRPLRPAPLPPYGLRIVSVDPPLSTDPARPTVFKVGAEVRVTMEYENPGPNAVRVWALPFFEGNIGSGNYVYGGSEEHPVGPKTSLTASFSFRGPGRIDAVTAQMGDSALKATVAQVSSPAYAIWELDPEQWQLELMAVKAPVVFDKEKATLSVPAKAGQRFTTELTVRYKTPQPTKLASNLLLKDANILPANLLAELESKHEETWHFDTESRPGYQSANGAATISFTLTGYAPPTPGAYTFDLNLGLFDKRTWDTILLKLFKVNLQATE